MSQADIAVVGLAVMGQNLILNMNDHGIKVVAYNRTAQKVYDFLSGAASGTDIVGATTIEEMINMLSKPRKIMLMVKAGEVVDNFICQLIPHLEAGDIIIDGGNSNFPDTERRVKILEDKGVSFIGTGVSGGEEGARFGPSIMPGGNYSAWEHVKDIFQKIAAKTPSGDPCCEWVGNGGAGHFVKMVHNGIEYGDMQLICEGYHYMKELMGLDNEQQSSIFKLWNESELGSYLIEITSNILSYQEDNQYVLDTILDAAGQKGTGKWTGITALDIGVPLTLIAESVFARCLSSRKDERVKAAEIYNIKVDRISDENTTGMLDDMQKALLFAKIISYAQGYMLMKDASEENNWNLNYGDIALMWREGCIIRSVFLDKIKVAYENNPELENLIFDPFFVKILKDTLPSARRIISQSITSGIAVPALASALSFFDGLITKKSPANLLQAQRDYFGAHTYEKVNSARGKFFHTDWIGSNSKISSSTYNV